MSRHSAPAEDLSREPNQRAHSHNPPFVFPGISVDVLIPDFHQSFEESFQTVRHEIKLLSWGGSKTRDNLEQTKPSQLALTDENYRSIIDNEIKRRLTAAGDNSTEVKKVMQTDIRVLLLPGMKRTFPCSQALIEQFIVEYREYLQSTASKKAGVEIADDPQSGYND